MSNYAISASTQANLTPVFGQSKGSARHGDRGDRDSSGDGNGQGITLLASLIQALTQAASGQSSTATGASTSTAAATGTAAAAADTGAATGTGASTGTGSSSSGSNLVQDLQAFLHDLFHALRQIGRSEHHGGDNPAGPATATNGATPVSPPAPDDDDSTANAASPATPGSVAVVTPAGTAPTSSTTPPTGGTTSTGSAGTAVRAYGQNGIISAVQTLVKDLGNSQILSSGGSQGLSSNTLSNLNSAFEKLIGDLGGSTPGAGSTGTGGSTAALQSFLTNFLQDLQNNGANSLSVGSSINTTA